jgi:glycosyltransferase involved in cell wall biosynthesis
MNPMYPSGQALRIAHLAFTTLPRTVGGLEIVVDNLIRKQIEAGHHVTLVTRWKQYLAFRKADFPYRALPLPPNPKLSSTPFGSVGPRWPVESMVRWHQWRQRFDVWHIHWVYPTGWMAHDALADSGVPVVMTAHGGDVETDAKSDHGFRLDPKNDGRVRDLMQRAACLTAISPSIEARFLELGADPARIRRIPNGVDFTRFHNGPAKRADVRSRFGIETDRTLILTVGRNRPAKGHKFIPPALASLLRQGRRASWIILGGDPDAMRELARREGVGEHLHVIPAILGEAVSGNYFPSDPVIELYKAADIFALPSLSEGFGIAALEAMAAGVPVVATDVPGLRSVIEHGRNGLLCRPADPEHMAISIGQLFDDQGSCHKIREAARNTAKGYDWRFISAQYLDLYGELIRKSRA